MKISLLIEGKERTFVAPFVSTRTLRRTMEIFKVVQKEFTVEAMDEVSQYMVDLYGKQFTIDQFLDGLAAGKFTEKVLEDMQEIIGGFSEQTKN